MVRLGYTFAWVADVEDTVRFYEEALGLQRRFLTDNGAMGLYAEMETGETTLAIADDREANALFPDGYRENDSSLAPSAFQISFIAEDVEAAYEQRLSRCPSQEPSHGARR